MSEEEKAIAVADQTDLAAALGSVPSTIDDDAVDASMGQEFMSRLQLMTSRSGACEDGFPINHFALISNGAPKDIGESCDVLVLAVRPKAMSNEDATLVTYQPFAKDADGVVQLDADGNKIANPAFARIQSLSEGDSTAYMWGPEFLLWLPEQEKYVTLFCCTKTLRREAPQIKDAISTFITFIPHKIETKKYSWVAIQSIECSTPGVMPGSDVISIVTKFKTPEDQIPEEVEETGTERER